MAIANWNGRVKVSTNLKPLQRLQRQSPTLFAKAMERGAIQFLTWANTGSMNESRTPPIRWGVLRGSSSAFVGNKLVATFPINVDSSAPESPTPAEAGGTAGLVITWAWNTDYAAKMHEWRGGWGKFTIQAGNAGNKWLEKHLRADRDALMKMIAIEFKREAKL